MIILQIYFLIYAALTGLFVHDGDWGWAAFMALMALSALAKMIIETLERGLA